MMRTSRTVVASSPSEKAVRSGVPPSRRTSDSRRQRRDPNSLRRTLHDDRVGIDIDVIAVIVGGEQDVTVRHEVRIERDRIGARRPREVGEPGIDVADRAGRKLEDEPRLPDEPDCDRSGKRRKPINILNDLPTRAGNECCQWHRRLPPSFIPHRAVCNMIEHRVYIAHWYNAEYGGHGMSGVRGVARAWVGVLLVVALALPALPDDLSCGRRRAPWTASAMAPVDAGHCTDAIAGNCTLRDAIAAALPNDTITFQSGSVGDDNARRIERIAHPGAAVTITGPGQNLLVISGGCTTCAAGGPTAMACGSSWSIAA